MEIRRLTNPQSQEGKNMFENSRKVISNITEIGMALLSLAIVATLLVGQTHMSFLGDVVGNITGMIQTLGSAGLAGLISMGAVIWLLANR
jgi:hypothetical protein